jgi:plasmid stabilization system protein ParE
MAAEIVWLPAAVADLERLRRFILEKNPDAAKRAVIRIREATKLLADHPERGRLVEDLFPFRDLCIPFGAGNYLLRYRVHPETHTTQVVIVRVWHSREQRI